MSEFRKTYLEVLQLDQSSSGPSEQPDREKALNRAYQLRTFEIEHYWKRATYFWGFQIAIFAAFGLFATTFSDPKWSPVTLALSGLGMLTALAGALSAHGSKFWQENWEKHIDMLEDEIEGRLHKTVWAPDGKIGFSVSRVNKLLSYYFVVFWVIAVIYAAWEAVRPALPDGLSSTVAVCVYTSAVIVVILVGTIFLFCQRSRLPGNTYYADGRERVLIERDPGAKVPAFISRHAPGEETTP